MRLAAYLILKEMVAGLHCRPLFYSLLAKMWMSQGD